MFTDISTFQEQVHLKGYLTKTFQIGKNLKGCEKFVIISTFQEQVHLKGYLTKTFQEQAHLKG